ncbi:MAG: glycosyltransferase family 4 protein, partial [Actinomycetota bacterium]|nr:glycosyltransferase family 4 protein [Actinomycetota bacterium]
MKWTGDRPATPPIDAAETGERKRLRVLRLCSVFEAPAGGALDARYDPVGGMQSHTGRLTRELDRRGVVQDVVTAWRPGAARRVVFGDHGTVYRLGMPLAWFRQGYALPAARHVRRLASSVDVVHAHLGEDLAVLPLAALAAGGARPLVVTVHCSLRRTLAVTGVRSAGLHLVGGWLEAWGGRRADALIVLTARLATAVVAGGVPLERVHVIPSGVDPGPERPPPLDPVPGAGRPRLLFVGRLVDQKGPDGLLEALARLASGASLVMVGDGPLRPRLQRQAVRLGIADRVHFTGFVPHELVEAHFCHADLLVLPSRYEELGSVLLEAMQAGLPVVATAVGGIPEVVVDGVTGRLLPPGDPAALASAVDGVLGDQAGAGRMGLAARERAAAYHWGRLAAQVHAVYE